MFEFIVSKVVKSIRHAVRAVGAATCRAPWLTAIAILVISDN